MSFEATETNDVTLSGNASANTKSSWSEIVGSTGFHYDAVEITLYAGETARYLVDIAIGASSSEVVIVDNLFTACPVSFNMNRVQIMLPLSIPAGTRLSARMSGDDTSGWGGTSENCSVQVRGFRASVPLAQRATFVQSHNIDTSATGITNTGAAGSTWRELSSGLSVPAIGFFLIEVDDGGEYDTSDMIDRFSLGFGAAASEVTVHDGIMTCGDGNGSAGFVSSYYPRFIPDSVRLSYQRTELSGNDNNYGAALYTVH